MSKTDHARSRISHHDMMRVGPEQVLTSGTDVATHSETTRIPTLINLRVKKWQEKHNRSFSSSIESCILPPVPLPD